MAWIQTGSTICFKPYSLDEALAGLAEAGFENVEIGAVKGFLEHLDPDELGPARSPQPRALLDGTAFACVSHERPRAAAPRAGPRPAPQRAARRQGARHPRPQHVHGRRRDPEEIGRRSSRTCARSRTRRRSAASRSASRPTRTCCRRPRSASTCSPRSATTGSGSTTTRATSSTTRALRPEDDIKHALGAARPRPPEGQARRQGRARLPAARRGRRSTSRDPRATSPDSGFSGPVSMEIEFTDYEYPDWEDCVEAARRGKAYWDSLAV